EDLAGGGDRSQSHAAGIHARDGAAEDAGAGLPARALGAAARGEHQGSGAIVDTEAVAGSDPPVFAKGRLKLRQLLQTGVAAGLVVRLHSEGARFAGRNVHCHDLVAEPPSIYGCDCPAVALGGKGILVLTGDFIPFSDVLSSLAHAIGVVHFRQAWINKAPTE